MLLTSTGVKTSRKRTTFIVKIKETTAHHVNTRIQIPLAARLVFTSMGDAFRIFEELQDSYSILRKDGTLQRHEMGSNVISLSPKPKHHNKSMSNHL